MTKALTYEQLLLLEPDAIRELYPFGAKEWKKRWLPVLEGEEPDRPLKKLLKDKKDIDRPRIPHRDSSKGYTDNVEMALGATTGRTRAGKTLRRVAPEPEGVDEATAAQYSAEGRNRQAQRKQADNLEGVARDDARRVSAALKAFVIHSVRCGIDPTPFLAEMQRKLKEEQARLKTAA